MGDINALMGPSNVSFSFHGEDKHTRITTLLASRYGVFQNQHPADVHAYSGLFNLIPLNLGKFLVTSYKNYSIESNVHAFFYIFS